MSLRDNNAAPGAVRIERSQHEDSREENCAANGPDFARVSLPSSSRRDSGIRVLNIDASGAGKIDTHKLRAARVVVDSNGVSKVEVYAAEQLDVTVSGPSHVIYEGDPVVKQTVHGPGSVEKKESEGA